MATLAEVEVLVKANLDPLIKASRETEKRAIELERKLDAALAKAPKQAQSEFQKLNRVLRSTGAIVGTISGSIAAGIFTRALTEFATFEQGMKNVQAVSGATADELKQLSNAALKAAATTRFNPKQTTEALYALASSGQNAQQQIASLPNVLNFAEAAQANLGQATEIVTSTLNVFGINAAESARVADVFTASIGASALNAERIAAAMRNAGPTAAALGQSFEQTTAGLAILTSAFGNGERAGTGLRAILVEMGDKAKTLGIKVKNSKGEFLPLVDIIQQIEKRGITATQVIETFGAEAGPALAALLSKGSQALVDMEGKIKSNGQAAKVASDQLNTLSGDFAGLQSAISAALVAIGESQSGVTREAIQAITNLIRYWSGYADTLGSAKEQTQSLSDIITVVAGIIAARFVAGLITAATATGALTTATVALTGALRILGLTTPLGLLINAVGIATFAFMSFRDEVDDGTRALAAQAQSGPAVQGMINDLATAQEAYKSAIAGTANVQNKATASIVADTKKEFEAKKSLLELEIKRQEALAQTAKIELRNKVQEVSSRFVGFESTSPVNRGVSDPRIGQFAKDPYRSAVVDQLQKSLTQGETGAKIKELRAQIDLTEVSTNKLREALATTFKSSEGGGGVDDNGGGKPPALGGGKGAKKSENDFQKQVQQIKERTAALQAEAAAQASLNPLVNDYGYAIEKARTVQELLTAAQNAGLAITPELRASIEALADGYATASTEAERLAEQQDKVKERAEEMKSFGKDVMSGFISDLRQGKSASEALANALNKVVDKLIDIALNSLFDGFGGGGGLGGLFSGIGRIFGFATGTANTGGRRGEPRGIVHGQEAVIPLPSGGKVPVDVRMPTALTSPQIGNQPQKVEMVLKLNTDDSAIADIADYQIKSAAPNIIRVSVQEGQKTTKANLPGMIAEAQTRNF